MKKMILRMIKQNRRQTPTILQMEATECGAASLAMVFAYYGLWIPLEKIRQECGVSRDGSKASNIVKAARTRGCEAKGYRWRADRLKESKVPLIIHWDFNHFVVLEEIDGDKVYINDPATGHRTVEWQEFKSSYTGIALEITPTERFKPSGRRYSIMAALARKLGEERGAMVFMMLIGLMMVVPGLATPVFSQVFLDDILTGKHKEWIFPLCFAMTAAFILEMALISLRAWCLTRWQRKLTLKDSGKFFWHVLRLPMAFFQQRYGGEVAARVQFNEQIAATLSGSAATALLDIFIALFYLLLLFQYNAKLTLIGLFFTSINISLLFLLRRRIVEMNMKIEQDRGKAHGAAMNGIQMIETIKANGGEADFFAKWAGYRTKVAEGMQKIELMSQTFVMLPLLLGGINTALIMTVGGFEIMDGLMTAGIFMAFQSLMTNFQQPINNLLALGQELQATEMQMMRLDDVRRYEADDLHYPEKEAPSIGKERLSGELEMARVTFGYSPLDAPLLENFCLSLKPGRWVALVGGSGSGKSTVANIAAGLYGEWSGQVLFDGIPRRDIARAVIVNSLACVSQDIVLFSGSVKENISLFDVSIPRGDIVRAAKDACIHDDILRLDGAYDGEIAEGGRNFSGGQRQRLEIARALANNPSLLILDEATSALDPVTEERVLQNIRRRGCACLLVAHRLSTIRDCDEIVVMERGRVMQRGTHAEMIGVEGPYHKLVRSSGGSLTEGGTA